LRHELRVKPVLDVEGECGGVCWHGGAGARGAPVPRGARAAQSPSRGPRRDAAAARSPGRGRAGGGGAAPGNPPRSWALRNLTPLLVAALSFAYLLTYPLAIGKADESHLLYGAKRVLEGEVIYKDFFEILTPLAYYLFAGIFRIAGTTLLAARVGMAAIEALGCGLLFHLTRRISGGAEATLVTLIFAGVCIPTWPYASPHWISTVLGLLVAMVTLARTGGDSSRARPLVAGIL